VGYCVIVLSPIEIGREKKLKVAFERDRGSRSCFQNHLYARGISRVANSQRWRKDYALSQSTCKPNPNFPLCRGSAERGAGKKGAVTSPLPGFPFSKSLGGGGGGV
jgi:hypothetical protein